MLSGRDIHRISLGIIIFLSQRGFHLQFCFSSFFFINYLFFYCIEKKFRNSKKKFLNCSNDSEIIEKCREYGVTVVNYQWLVDIYLGLKNVVNENENCYFPMPNMVSEVNVSPYALEHFSDLCKQLLGLYFLMFDMKNCVLCTVCFIVVF